MGVCVPCRYPGSYSRYLELKAARIAAVDAEAQRARTKLRRESEWMARQPKYVTLCSL
jgi:ATPase subunit of ABC transporter with duplicated ATPase domains